MTTAVKDLGAPLGERFNEALARKISGRIHTTLMGRFHSTLYDVLYVTLKNRLDGVLFDRLNRRANVLNKTLYDQITWRLYDRLKDEDGSESRGDAQ